MTELRGRRLAALTIIPVSAGVFGTGIAWADANDPMEATTQTTAAPATMSTAQIVADKMAAARVRLLQMRVDDASVRIGELQAVVDERNAAAEAASQAAAAQAAAAQAAAARSASASSSSRSSSSSSHHASASAPAPAPPPTNTSTRGSG